MHRELGLSNVASCARAVLMFLTLQKLLSAFRKMNKQRVVIVHNGTNSSQILHDQTKTSPFLLDYETLFCRSSSKHNETNSSLGYAVGGILQESTHCSLSPYGTLTLNATLIVFVDVNVVKQKHCNS